MPVTLELPDDLAETLGAEAIRRGLSIGDYALCLLTPSTPRIPVKPSGTELVAYWEAQGLLGTRTDIADGQAEARRLREMAQNRLGE